MRLRCAHRDMHEPEWTREHVNVNVGVENWTRGCGRGDGGRVCVLHRRRYLSQMALQRCNVNFLARFLGWILEGEFWEVNFSSKSFSGSLFCLKKQSQKIRPKNSGRKLGVQNSALNSGSGGAKSPVQTFVPNAILESRRLAWAYTRDRHPLGPMRYAWAVGGAWLKSRTSFCVVLAVPCRIEGGNLG